MKATTGDRPPGRGFFGKPEVALSVVIPAYNEEQRLARAVERVSSFFAVRGIDGEIIVVDDGSRDRTRTVAMSLQSQCQELRVLGYDFNRGKGSAVRLGVLESRGKAVLYSDADLSTSIEEMDYLWPHLEAGSDVVIASRHLRQSRILVNQPFHRRHLGRVFNTWIRLLGVRGFMDTQCGFKLFRREAAHRLFSLLRTEGFAFDVEILVHAQRLGFRIAEVPVHWSHSPVSRVHPVRDSIAMALQILRIRSIL